VAFRDYLAVLRKYWISIVALTLLGGVAAVAYISLAPPVYTAQSTVSVSVNSGSSAAEIAAATSAAVAQARFVAPLVTTNAVLDQVITNLGLNTSAASLAGRVSASVPTNTALITVAARDSNAARSAKIADGVAASLVDTITASSPKGGDGNPVIQATIASPATVPGARTSPRGTQSLALGIIAGLVVGLGFAILRKVLDVRVHTSADVTEATDYPVIASIPRDLSLAKNPVVMMAAPTSAASERYRELRTNLRFFDLDSDSPWTFAVTSSIEGEGKTVTSINIAYALAESGDKVLLVDADLRRPKIANYLQLEARTGLTTVLLNRAGFADVVQPLGVGCPDVLAAGAIPPNPAELIGSRRMRQLLEQVSREYSTVVIDTAPLLPVADTLSLLPHVSGTVIVASAGKATIPELKSALGSIERAGARIMGIVVNKVRWRGGHEYYYYTHEGHTHEARGEVKNDVRRPKKGPNRAEL